MEHVLSHSRAWIAQRCLIGFLLLGTACHAEKPGTSSTAPPSATSLPSSGNALPEVPASHQQELRNRVGQKILLTGEVSRIGQSASGHRFINFQGNPDLTLFISADDLDHFRPDLPEQRYAGKTIAVTGELERFKDKLQIRIRAPETIRIITRPASGPPDKERDLPAGIELKSMGKERWISPAGLIYAGRDPDGRPRKDHVLRHARDIPDRDGPHGVFDGGEERAFAWIDLAWERIQSQHIRPEQEEGRDVYTVSMGRRVGYLGGETGARQQHPPLHRIFLVLRHGTTEVVTAFPK